MQCCMKNATTKQKVMVVSIVVLIFGLAIGFGVGYRVGGSRARTGFARQQELMMRQGFGQNRGGRAIPGSGRRMMRGLGAVQTDPSQAQENGTIQNPTAPPSPVTSTPSATAPGATAPINPVPTPTPDANAVQSK